MTGQRLGVSLVTYDLLQSSIRKRFIGDSVRSYQQFTSSMIASLRCTMLIDTRRLIGSSQRQMQVDNIFSWMIMHVDMC